VRNFDVAAPGVGAAEWRGWLDRAAIRPLDVSAVRHAVVVAPHPDDETLGMGGTLQRLRRSGVRLTIVGVTDGEAANPAACAYARADLARRRRVERARALRVLGVPSDTFLLFGLPDGRVNEHEDRLAVELERVVGGDSTIFATWGRDRHPDHEATSRAARAVAAARGARVVEYPIWAWQWDAPGAPEMPWDRARQVALTAAELRRKQEAVDAYVSQLTGDGDRAPVLPEHVRARLVQPREIFFGIEP
jgi:LmbE family N-acetylglucosaminyl deacetylase